MDQHFSILGIPIDSLGFSGDRRQGTELSPQALRDLGLARMLSADDLGDADVRIEAGWRDEKWGIVSHDSVVATTGKLRAQVADLQRQGRRLLVLGGCCTQIMGVLAGSRDAVGEVGLAYGDGHLDLYDGQTSPTGEAADVPLASLLGHGPATLTKVLGPGSVLNPGAAFLFGYRDETEAAKAGSLMPGDIGPQFNSMSLVALRAEGVAASGRRIVQKLEESVGKFWIHLDLDILADTVFTATDYLMPDGLFWEELDALMRPICQSSGLIGVAVACYNPSKDPDLTQGKRLAEHLQSVLRP